ncbi:type II toxin-antitoxin system Phd/YefM family antitoxin [Methanoplanus endosymbiosus]|uniref:Type II toxin-antitoxin system Phd/YefM family antitoxin n=1 Tax=Methanoplanus endosymbiosus TaxID=33865 RepID=A0A9E7PNK6_9EURY|nr:type II toxin-antitoxin system Phd/YefM family antitoxin [Methanoplanus endosymbiosus]UUX93160.1 type II toxin-antitoxin system Phd/YefM family antitoxin [Methanoplanus endosymbiosus]
MTSCSEQYIVDENGNKISVILPFSEYQKMQEDLHDLAVIAERKNEETIDINELKRRIGK